MSKILSNLYLGNMKDRDRDKYDLNIDLSFPDNEVKKGKTKSFRDGKMLVISIGLEDHGNSKIKKIFNITGKMINDYLNKDKKVLVNCRAGISRSPSIIIAYLMKYHNMNFNDAIMYVFSKRDIINPNYGFLKQLEQYEKYLK